MENSGLHICAKFIPQCARHLLSWTAHPTVILWQMRNAKYVKRKFDPLILTFLKFAVTQSQIVKFEMSILKSWQIVFESRLAYAFDTQLHYLNYTIYLSLPPIPVATNFKLDSLYLILSSCININFQSLPPFSRQMFFSLLNFEDRNK